MKTILTLLSISLFILCFTFVEKPYSGPSIKINSPLANGIYKKGDTIKINALVTADHGIHNLALTVSPDGFPPMFTDNLHSHANSLNYEKSFVQSLKIKTKLKIKLVMKDDAGNISAVDSVIVSAN